jgi:hypothetical protein
MLYGSQIWGLRNDGGPAAASLLQPLAHTQAKSLRRIAGAYKRTPTAAIEREVAVPPINLYVDATALQRADSTSNHPVTKDITKAADAIWARMQCLNDATQGRRRRRVPVQRRPPSSCEAARTRAYETRVRVQGNREPPSGLPPGRHSHVPGGGGHQHRWKQKTAITKWMD